VAIYPRLCLEATTTFEGVRLALVVFSANGKQASGNVADVCISACTKQGLLC
jgi:hypothetical protein